MKNVRCFIAMVLCSMALLCGCEEEEELVEFSTQVLIDTGEVSGFGFECMVHKPYDPDANLLRLTEGETTLVYEGGEMYTRKYVEGEFDDASDHAISKDGKELRNEATKIIKESGLLESNIANLVAIFDTSVAVAEEGYCYAYYPDGQSEGADENFGGADAILFVYSTETQEIVYALKIHLNNYVFSGLHARFYFTE